MNEVSTVVQVVEGVRRTLTDATIIVVDDGSHDGTGDAARRAGALVVTHPKALGYATALRDGLVEALGRGAELLLHLDADGQHDPADLPAILRALEDHDLVIGSRFLGSGYKMGPARRLGIALCQVIVRAGGLNVTDPTSGLRGMTREVAANIAEHGFPDGLTESSYLISLARAGRAIGEVPVKMTASESDSMHDGVSGLWHFGRIVRASARAAARSRRDQRHTRR